MTTGQRIAGVLGGMGPEATVDFMSKVIAATPVQDETDHIRLLVDQNPKTPSRQAAILADGEDPGPVLAAMAAGLESAGADFLVIACNTAYVFQDSVLAVTSIPLVSIVDVTIDEVQARAPGAATVALLATEGCLRARVYQDALEARGLVSLVPTSKELARVMQLVGSVKIGTHGAKTRAGMCDIALALVERGADAIIAGCTEIPLVLDQEQVPVPLVESTGALARRTVALALGKLPLPAREA